MIELTELEYNVFQAIVIDGLVTRKEIGQRFKITVVNANYPITSIYKKFKVNNFAKLIWAYYTKKLPSFKKMDENKIKRQKTKKITEFFEQLTPEQKIRFLKMREFGFTNREIISEIKNSPK